ncbi:MAG: single-stranded-DNA-specific exonuclease RecJ [Nostoc sp.]|uniref:single-stranded-DNA-specific exonuclease RecJ n=1 Tax=Nostoc sp. TaxID=1180 RepID=UPI002FF7B45D
MAQRKWHEPKHKKSNIKCLTINDDTSSCIAPILLNRGMRLREEVQAYLYPESMPVVDPYTEFTDLSIAVDIIQDCIDNNKKITICGDYDADGMTSTAVLIRALRHCGAIVDYVIPSRMTDGYGVNERIVDECSKDGTDTIITVDNGISAKDACDWAVTLGMRVIITDHHDIPDELPLVHAILNPKLLDEYSPYRSLAGVGVAYILAISVCARLSKSQGIVKPLMELFTIGTIADMASLTGVNRRWVKRGLQYLAKSDVVGVQAILCCMNEYHKQRTGYPLDGMTPDTIGFKIAPRINAIGRIGNPQTVIELLTTESSEVAYSLAVELEDCNEKRKVLCERIEREAIEVVEVFKKTDINRDRVICIAGDEWHHGVIGIVASRLVERYGVPIFIATRTEEGETIRGSARGIPGFNVYDCLHWCDDVLAKYGGHPMAGGFSMLLKNWRYFTESCVGFARRTLKPTQIGTHITIDATILLTDIDSNFVSQLKQLQPFGVGNSEPIFRANNVHIWEQKILGKGLKFSVWNSNSDNATGFKAISWSLGERFPLPSWCDIVFKIKENTFRGETSIQLEVIDFREITVGDLLDKRRKATSLITTC